MQSVTRMAEQAQEETLSSAVAGDEAAFARLVADFDDEMHRVCVAVCRDQTVAADAVQSAWTIVWKKLASVRHPASVRPWLVTVAVNEARKLLKKRGRRSEVEHRRRGRHLVGVLGDRERGRSAPPGQARR